MKDETREELTKLVQDYVHCIEEDDDHLKDLFAGNSASLISVARLFDGTQSIEQDFLKGAIRKAYSTIKLIPENLDIRLLNDKTALIIFQYHTECIRRDTGEPYGIQGLETQIAIREEDGWKLAHVHYSKK